MFVIKETFNESDVTLLDLVYEYIKVVINNE